MSPLAQHAADTASLAWSASDNNTIDAFLASPEWLAFLAAAEAATYIYSELELPLNETSVRNAAEQAAQFAHSVYDNETASDTVAAHEAEALTARIAAAEPAPRTRYLEEAELDQLVLTAKVLRKGRKLAAYAKAPYLVIVDGEYLWLRDVRALRRTLSTCYLNWSGVVPFRNYDGGVTFNLDEAREAQQAAVAASVPVDPVVLREVTGDTLVTVTHPGGGTWSGLFGVWAIGRGVEATDAAAHALAAHGVHDLGEGDTLELAEVLVVAQEEQEQQAEADPDALGTVAFIVAVEEGTITDAQFEASAQAFVDTGAWRSLQGSWGRAVESWAAEGLVSL